MHAAFPAGPVLLTQHFFQDFARSTLRQAVDELDGLRDLEAREVSPAVLQDFGLGRRLPRAQGDQRLGRLAPSVVGDRNHSALKDGRMVVEDALDFRAGDVLAAAQDHVFDAVDDQDVALFVDRGQVAG